MKLTEEQVEIERDDFEEWCANDEYLDVFSLEKYTDGRYVEREADMAWAGWLARAEHETTL